jgi:purine-binding chemotaxis protein CheW
LESQSIPVFPQAAASDPPPAMPDSLHLVTFRVGDEEFGLDILRVSEIIRPQDLTRVPNSPGFVEGVINLHGRVIPIVSLRKCFGLPAQAYDKQSRIIVLEIQNAPMGLVVDSVSEVLQITTSAIAPAPRLDTAKRNYVSGIAKLADRLVILVDMNRLLDQPPSSSTAEA